MPLKAMIFVDGNWFYHSRQILFALKEENGFEIDYKRIPLLVKDWLMDELDVEVDVSRTCYFGALAVNKPGYNSLKQRTFYQFLNQDCGFDVEVLEVDHRAEQGSCLDDCGVGISLGAAMMHYAAIPAAYDIGVIVAGSSDYRPLLKRVRNLGRRTMLVAIRNDEARNATSKVLLEEPGLFDVPPLFLDAHIEELRLVRKEQMRVCRSCGAMEATTWAGSDFYCSKCRSGYQKRIRACDTCGREEETSWDKDYFYCMNCRKEFKKNAEGRVDGPVHEIR